MVKKREKKKILTNTKTKPWFFIHVLNIFSPRHNHIPFCCWVRPLKNQNKSHKTVTANGTSSTWLSQCLLLPTEHCVGKSGSLTHLPVTLSSFTYREYCVTIGYAGSPTHLLCVHVFAVTIVAVYIPFMHTVVKFSPELQPKQPPWLEFSFAYKTSWLHEPFLFSSLVFRGREGDKEEEREEGRVYIWMRERKREGDRYRDRETLYSYISQIYY